ncbi:MAG TPA: hypothetical protein VHR45_24680 [Thermoanaerobaculia bacterium]|nr:hypothetical protein [Thermoanaerobaculia bacterium]
MRAGELREWASIDAGGVVIGPLGGRRVRYLFASRERAADLGFFARTYAPFRLAMSYEELIFRGRGSARAGPVEQRMIGEWARLVGVEAPAGASASAYGLAFAWHRGASAGGVCEDLAVYLTGEVRASPCSGEPELRGRLDAGRLARLYAWYDGLAPFQSQGEQGVRADALLERLIFAGRGGRPASPREESAIEALAVNLYRELTAPPAPPPPAKKGPLLRDQAAEAAGDEGGGVGEDAG